MSLPFMILISTLLWCRFPTFESSVYDSRIVPAGGSSLSCAFGKEIAAALYICGTVFSEL